MDKIEVDVNDLPGRFAELVAKVSAGEEVVVTERGQPSAKLSSLAPDAPPTRPARTLGLGVGRGPYWMAPDFDAPLPDEFWFGEDR